MGFKRCNAEGLKRVLANKNRTDTFAFNRDFVQLDVGALGSIWQKV